MKRLAAYAALIAVPTLIAGIYSMNFDYMLELRWRHGYTAALSAMAVIDGYLLYRLRKAKWLRGKKINAVLTPGSLASTVP